MSAENVSLSALLETVFLFEEKLACSHMLPSTSVVCIRVYVCISVKACVYTCVCVCPDKYYDSSQIL